jgi:hypothetical protein
MKTYSLLAMISVILASGSSIFAADHLDSPVAVASPEADITDVYTWAQADTNGDGDDLVLIMNVAPNTDADAYFSDAIQYVFHVSSQATFGGEQTDTDVICTFDAEGLASCWVGEDQLIADEDASVTAGVSNDDEEEDLTFTVFAGLRDDPFFFAFEEFTSTVTTVKDAAPLLTFDEANCPALDAATQSALVTSLTSGTENFFEGHNILSLVVQVDQSLLGDGPIYGVSAATYSTP